MWPTGEVDITLALSVPAFLPGHVDFCLQVGRVRDDYEQNRRSCCRHDTLMFWLSTVGLRLWGAPGQVDAHHGQPAALGDLHVQQRQADGDARSVLQHLISRDHRNQSRRAAATARSFQSGCPAPEHLTPTGSGGFGDFMSRWICLSAATKRGLFGWGKGGVWAAHINARII